MITQDQINGWFASPITDEKLTKIKVVRDNGATMASILISACPDNSQAESALHSLRFCIEEATNSIIGGK